MAIMGKQIQTTPGTGKLYEAAHGSATDALKLMDSTLEGLTEAEVEQRREVYGTNEVAHERVPSWWVYLGRAFANPFIGVLLALGIISWFTDVVFAGPEGADWAQIIILLAMILASGILQFWQEYRSQRAAEELKAMVQVTATVTRSTASGAEPQKYEVPLADLVPGDIIHLSAGDMIPADVRLLNCKDLFVSQSALTGESLPVGKPDVTALNGYRDGTPSEAPDNLLDAGNLCFLGTDVMSGTATAVVVATGADTIFGSLASRVTEGQDLSSFDRGIRSVSWVLIKFMAVMVPIVFVINGITKGHWGDAFLFSLAVAVGLTPEMLPMVVSVNLAKGALQMAKEKVIVKRLSSIQDLGAMDILCTDKTGTLTEDRVTVREHLDINGEDDQRVLELAYLNSSFQTGLNNLMDEAIIRHMEAEHESDGTAKYWKVDEIPFGFIRRRMSVVVTNEVEEHLFICKGAVEEVVALCTHVEVDGHVRPIDADIRVKILDQARKNNNDGIRILAVAYKGLPPERMQYGIEDEKELTLVGFIGFLDPPKASAAPALAALIEHGVDVKVLTGDTEAVVAKVCREVGLDPGNVVEGHMIDDLSDEELAELAEVTTVFAKVAPLQKARIVRLLKEKGHTVGFLGDGINDAAALREADVGISVDTAVDIAKESADIILLEKSLLVLEQGVMEGRKVFGNIIKYIKMTASSNFGNVFSVLVASAFIPFLPMLPIQLLTQNLLYDFSQLSLPWDNMDPEFLAGPRKWDSESIAKFMVYIGPISSIFDIVTFLVMWYVFGANSAQHQSLFQSGWFVLGLLSQTLIVHLIRTEKVPFVQSRASTPVLLLTGAIMALGALVPFTGFGAGIGLESLPASYFPWLIGILFAYSLTTQWAKNLYIRRFGTWL